MEQKYFVLFNRYNDTLSCRIGDKYCIPADDWTEAREGLITNIQFTGTKTINGQLYHTIKADFVDTELIDITAEFSNQVYDIICLGDNVLYQLYSKKRDYWDGGFLFQLATGETIKLRDYPDSLLRHRENPNLRYYIASDLLTAHIMKYGIIDTAEKAYLALMKLFTPTTLDCCDQVTIVDDGMIYISYPGAYKSSCRYVVLKNQKYRNVGYGPILLVNSENKRVITLEQIITYMKNNYISAGTDSKDEIPGISPRARKIFTTLKAPNGALIVQFKAECFKPSYASNPQYLSVITKDIVHTKERKILKWLYRYGEYNEYISWID